MRARMTCLQFFKGEKKKSLSRLIERVRHDHPSVPIVARSVCVQYSTVQQQQDACTDTYASAHTLEAVLYAGAAAAAAAAT